MATIDVYILNATEKAEFDALSTNGGVPSKFWKNTATIGGAGSGAAPFYLLWWSPWKMMSSIWWDIAVYYDPSDGGAQVSGGSGHYTATTPTRKTFKKGSGHYYVMPLTNITNNVSALDATAKAVGAAYASRSADAYRISLTPWEHWTDGKWYKYGPYTVNAVYAPTTLTNAALGNLDATDIELSFKVGDWTRETDTWVLTGLAMDGEEYKPIGGSLRIPTTLDGSAPPVTELALPRKAFATPPQLVDSETFYAELWLESLRTKQRYTITGTVSVTSITAPRCAIVREDDGGVTVYVEAYSGAGDATVASVALVGAVYSGDIAEGELSGVPTENVQIGGTTVACVPFSFPAAPRGAVRYVVTAADPSVGEATVELSLSAFADGYLWIVPTIGGEPYAAVYNIDLRLSADWDSDTVQLAGRDRPSAFYGESASAKWSASWDVPCESIGDGLPTLDSQIAAARALTEGSCIAEFPTGERHLVQVAGLSIGRGNNTGLASFSCSITEVAG